MTWLKDIRSPLRAQIVGIKFTQRKFRKLTQKHANRATSKALMVGARIVRDTARKSVPGKWAHLSKAIGAFQTKQTDARIAKSLKPVKIGWGVGKKRGMWSKKNKHAVGRGAVNGKGVGINQRNIHWFVLGTMKRWTGYQRKRVVVKKDGYTVRHKIRKRGGKPPQYTGKIGRHWGSSLRPIFRRAMKTTKRQVIRAMKKSAVKDYKKILAKERAKRKG